MAQITEAGHAFRFLHFNARIYRENSTIGRSRTFGVKRQVFH